MATHPNNNVGGGEGEENDSDLLRLSLSTGPQSRNAFFNSSAEITVSEQMVLAPSPFDYEQFQSPMVIPEPPAVVAPLPEMVEGASHRPTKRIRRYPTQTFQQGKSAFRPEPYPWATNRRARIHSLDTLLSNGVHVISAKVECKRCEREFEIEYNLKEKFNEVRLLVIKNMHTMHHRAPAVWTNPVLPDCKFCKQENCVKPIVTKKRSINWLFLLLGQMIGVCKLSQLKYFCEHTEIHRTGAKDRLLFSTYLELCRQLVPKGPLHL